VTLGVRPEDVRVALATAPGWVPAQVYVVEAMGHETVVTVSYAGALVLARAGADFTAQIGDTVWLQFDSEKLHLFDRSSGRSRGATN
jgi:multiple sugar transport system ATP-binding protein